MGRPNLSRAGRKIRLGNEYECLQPLHKNHGLPFTKILSLFSIVQSMQSIINSYLVKFDFLLRGIFPSSRSSAVSVNN